MGYLDPGLFGLLSQVGLAIFMIVVSAFTFFFRPIKTFLKKTFKKDSSTQSENQSEEK